MALVARSVLRLMPFKLLERCPLLSSLRLSRYDDGVSIKRSKTRYSAIASSRLKRSNMLPQCSHVLHALVPQRERNAGCLCQHRHSDMPPSLAATSVSAVLAILRSVRVEARNVKEVLIRHFSLAACASAKVEIECSRRRGVVDSSAVVVPGPSVRSRDKADVGGCCFRAGGGSRCARSV